MARYSLHRGSCFEWMEGREENSIHAIVTDPPYGLKEYTPEEKAKLRNGHGGVWRISAELPFEGVIRSAPTRPEERRIAPRPSLKPQAFVRQIVRASLPLEKGIVLDPFMGAGSTIAAALAVGYDSIGVESDSAFFKFAERAIPKLAEFGAPVPRPAAKRPLRVQGSRRGSHAGMLGDVALA